ncbi:MAG: ClC family H(+)/Cl(-) exchange transporter [Tepidanaerobacteraceae bacterium]|nr:ClC family H(+)/Cl(-) exchange transporter [Tepidanaerobacteraceae bacterium]
MRVKKSGIYNTLVNWKNFKQKLIAEGLAIGIAAGAVAALYRFIIKEADLFREQIYHNLRASSNSAILIWFVFLLATAYILGVIVKKEPSVSGSGIPQVKGVLSGQMRMNWIRVILYKFFGGIIALGVGLSLGREGPSVQLGAAAGQGVSRILGRIKVEEKYLITCGASAGLAAAFSAPLAGTIFALEELHKNFSPLVLVPAMAASMMAGFISHQFFGQAPVFNFGRLDPIPLRYYGYVFIMGIIIGVFGVIFNLALIKTQEIYRKLTFLRQETRPVIPIFMAGVLGFFMPQVLGGGNALINSLDKIQYAVGFIIILLIVKFLFTMISYGSGVPGGIFLPLLVIGALVGDVYGTFIVNVLHIDPGYVKNFIVLAMAGYFSAIVKAPITGGILITEMTGSFVHLLALTLISLTSYLTADLLNGQAIYDLLLDRILDEKKKRQIVSGSDRKVLMEIPVCVGSELDGKRIRDVEWDPHCLLVSINRGTTEIIPRGYTRIYPGDYLVVLADNDRAAEIRIKLTAMAEKT